MEIEQAFNNIDGALKQINTSRDNHIILAQNLSLLKSKSDDCEACKKEVEFLRQKVDDLEVLVKSQSQ